jgi:lipoprotein-anchoring transpeptidase ErfK/SrfK
MSGFGVGAAVVCAALAMASLVGCASGPQLSAASARQIGEHALWPTTTPIISTPSPTPVAASATACSGTPTGVHHIYVSVSAQTLWACAGSALFTSTSVTTGASGLTNVHDATPIGTWRVYNKVRNTVLRGHDANGSWRDPVAYWMPFYGAYGFHDASWQTFPFGSSLYTTQGSHGCVHVPVDVLGAIYNWAPIGTLVTVQD